VTAEENQVWQFPQLQLASVKGRFLKLLWNRKNHVSTDRSVRKPTKSPVVEGQFLGHTLYDFTREVYFIAFSIDAELLALTKHISEK